MLRRFVKDKKAASEIVGTALFLVILFFFFTNVFLWHDQVTRDMDQIISDKKNSAIRVEAYSNASNHVWLKVDNIGGLTVTLSRLWITSDTYHYFADLEPDSVHIEAGRHVNITFVNETISGQSSMGEVGASSNTGSVIVQYVPVSGDAFRILTRRANSAACSLP